MRSVRLLFFVAITFALPTFADQVTLTNGDRLTGTILKSDDKTLTLKTALAGTIEIQWSGIKELTTDEQLAVTTASAPKPYSGTVTAKDGSVVVTPTGGTPTTVPQTDIKALRSPAEQAAYEASLHPPLTRGWKGGINLGFALTGGNSQTTNLAIAFNALRPTSTDKLSLYANTVYATNNAAIGVSSTTANNTHGGLRYDRNLTQKLFAFVNADFDSNALQDLNLRSLVGGGLGFHAIKSDTTTLDFLGGANYTRENYTTFTRNSAALTAGDEFMHKFGASTVLIQKFFFYPDMSDLGQYHFTFNTGTVTKLSKWLGWQNSFDDIYVTNPPIGKKKNDIIFTTGLNIAFTH